MKPAFQPYEGPEPYIFARYSPEDTETVIPILDALHRAGYRVWYYRVQAGHRRDDVIAEHILKCAVFLLLFSRSSIDSDECYEETSYALYKKRVIVPVYLDAAKLPPGLEMRLHFIQDMRLSNYGSTDHFALALQYEKAFELCKIPDRHTI